MPLIVALLAAISIHAPHTRSDTGWDSYAHPSGYFNPRSSYEERPLCLDSHEFFHISIHAPHTRSDRKHIRSFIGNNISIHAPHTRSDPHMMFASLSTCFDFNPRSSYEERRETWHLRQQLSTFQSTLLIRGATRFSSDGCSTYSISIHAPHTRSDLRVYSIIVFLLKFQSTLLIRGATDDILQMLWDDGISIHAPHTRSDLSVSPQARR